MLAIKKQTLFAATLMLASLAGGGCSSRFAGEWVQESVRLDDGSLGPVTSKRRMALQFIPPSTLRMGAYSDDSRLVDPDTVSSSDYQTIQNFSVAEFGSYTARVVNGELIAYISGQEKGRFRKLSGPSVFPPRVRLPEIAGTRGNDAFVLPQIIPAEAPSADCNSSGKPERLIALDDSDR